MGAATDNAVTVASESNANGQFYVPTFEVRIKGKKLPRDVVRDVIQVTYRDKVDEIDSFDLTVNNWDADTRIFKYVGKSKDPRGANPHPELLDLFDPGDLKKEVEVWMGYTGNLRLMMTGFFVTQEPNFPQSGSSTLAVRGLNLLWQLKGKQYTYFWPTDGRSSVRDSDIARDIGNMNDPDTGEKRFRLPVRVDDNARDAEPDEPYVFQNSQYDIVFLLTRARRHDYEVFIEEDPQTGEKQLYFGPSTGRSSGQRDVTYKLEWGKSLIQFKPTLTVANQVGSITVRGWDRHHKKPIVGTATRKQTKLNQDLSDLDPAFNQREEIITGKPVHTQKQAEAMARDLLRGRLKDLVKASGATVGLPDLRAGRRVVIDGPGNRFNGTYFVTDTTHTINDSGYITTFNARREEEGEAKTA